MNRFVAILAAAGVVAATGATLASTAQASGAPTPAAHPTGPAPADFTPAPLVFGQCASSFLQSLGGECGTLEVPLDYANPNGKRIKLAVSRIKATVPADQYQGVMLVNPGGPGGSGLLFSFLGQLVPNNAGAAYDWIGFDPRGVGASTPSLTCDANYLAPRRPSYQPEGASQQAWLAKIKKYASDCKAAGGELLGHMKTTDNVADMESIRKALGQRQINFYGVSYGTYLGQVYATLHPDRLRRAVFDSNVDPQLVWYPHVFQQSAGLEHNVRTFFDWVGARDGLYHLGNSGAAVEATYQSTLTRLATNAAIGPSELADVVSTAAITNFSYTDVAEGLSALVNQGDPSRVLATYSLFNGFGSPGADNSNAVLLATKCTDAPWPTDFGTWQRDTVNSDRQAPFYSWANTWAMAPCMSWAAPPAAPVKVGSAAPSILLVNETFDSLTPISGDLTVRSLFPHSALIEGVGGVDHLVALSGNTCMDNQVADYLTAGTLPARLPGNQSDGKCPPLVPPDLPAPTSAARSGAAHAPATQAGSVQAGSAGSRPSVTALRALLRQFASQH